MRLENWFITNPDESQQEILKVPIEDNLVVKGAAGSGKTNMAIYRANQAKDNSFIIIVYTVALKKMVRYGLSELGIDKDRVVHEWSWINRGIELSGDLFCFGRKECECTSYNNHPCTDENILILREDDYTTRIFIHDTDNNDDNNPYNRIIKSGTYNGYNVVEIEDAIKVSVDFDDFVENRFYYSFYRRRRWFTEVKLEGFSLNPDDENIVFIPSGFLFKEKGLINYIIVDEGQDFSISDYDNNFISKSEKSITIFGDTNQLIYGKRGTDVKKIATNYDFPLKTLQYNYRVPKTIARIAQTIPNDFTDLISNNRKNNGVSDFPNFPKPIIKKCQSEEDEIDYIIKRIETEGLDDVAILLWRNETVEKVHKMLQSKGIASQVRYTMDDNTVISGFRKVDTLDFTNHDLPCLLTFHSAKGTEFDNVFIPFANDDMNMDRKTFYVAVTRSSSRLIITHSRKLTTLLDKVDKNNVIIQ